MTESPYCRRAEVTFKRAQAVAPGRRPELARDGRGALGERC